MRTRSFSATIAILLTIALPGVAVAHDDHTGRGHIRAHTVGDGVIDTPVEYTEEFLGDEHPEEDDDHQHGGETGHLPPSDLNVQLVGKVELTGVANGIADVGAFGNYAYLNAFSPECAGRPGAQGTGVHVVDISNPATPTKVGFLAAEPNSYVGEGVHIVDYDGTHVLVHNNETCDSSQPVVSGFAVWDVTNPLAPSKLGQFGDTTPAVANQIFHTTHSVQAFVWGNKVYAVAQDNQDLKDVDIFDITPTLSGGAAGLVWEGGLEDWPTAHSPLANGDTVFHHDMQQKVIDGHNFLLVSYWDAGQILLNIDVPSNPVFVQDSDFPSPDSLTDFQIAEGNSHQSYWSSDGKFVLSSDEDFSPTRTLCEIETGPNAGATGCGEFGFTAPLSTNFPGGLTGETIWGGSGCTTDENGNGVSDRAEVPSQASSGADIVVFSRGVCFFSDKIRSGEEAGYTAVAVGNSHGGSRAGLVPDAFLCGGQGSPVLGTASGICIGHRGMHQLFNDPPAYTGAEGFTAGGDLPAIGTLGETLSAQGGVFDGWGYVRLHDGTTLQELDAYAVAEGLDPAYRTGFGNLTVHEVKTDPRPNSYLAYLSYYDAGLRVVKFGKHGIREVGHYIAEGGNDFWGTFPIQLGKSKGAPYLLMSDRDDGLWIFRYTGD